MSTAILLSGGIDSVALAFWRRPAIAFTVDYGQIPAEAEIRAAAHICKELSIEHEVIRVDCRSLGSGALSSRPASALSPTSEWWPFRNQLLVTLTGMKMIALKLNKLLVGSVANDTQYADGSEHFYTSIDTLMALQEGNIHVNAPAKDLTSLELVHSSGIPLSMLSWAHSCHRSNTACGRCRGCLKHLDIFEQLGLL